MSKIQNALIPSFLKRLDFWLMTHKPHIWRTKGHFVVFYGTITAVLFFIFGLLYPFTLFELQERLSYSSNVNFAFTVMSFFIVLGGLFLWWFSIQKYAYKRTNLKHFFIEIGIYTVGCFTLWTVFLAFSMGFDYKKCYLLEKNTPEDKEWFNQHSFPEFGYMPHVDPNKLSDLNKYFSNGEQLIEIQWNRAKKTEKYNRDISKSKNYHFEDANMVSILNSLDWEIRTSNNKTFLPPQYKKPSDYFNKLIGDTGFRDTVLQEHNKILIANNKDILTNNYIDDGYNKLFDKIITGFDYNSIVELTENIYPRYFHHIDFTSESHQLLNDQVIAWINQRTFLESLNTNELTIFKNYLADLFDCYKNFRAKTSTINQLQFTAYYAFYEHLENSEKDSLGILDYSPTSRRFGSFGSTDQNAIAAEKLQKVLHSFDLESSQKYTYWIARSDDSFINDKELTIQKQVDNAYSTLKASSLDSLMLYDYYFLNMKNYDSYRAFFTNAYTDYLTQKYTSQDFERLNNLLFVNGFPNEPPQYKDSKLLKIHLLSYSDRYRRAIKLLEFQRASIKVNRAYRWSPFSALYCILGALIFYIVTLSKGIQLWVSLFMSVLYFAITRFFNELFSSNVSNYSSLHDKNIFHFYLMVIHSISFIALIFLLFRKKYQWSKAHIVVNTVLLSGIGGIIAAMVYWEPIFRYWQSGYGEIGGRDYFNNIKVMSTVFLVAILLYGVVAWLFKRHLTYPKKR